MALPDALIALWLEVPRRRLRRTTTATRIMIAALGLAASATATWFLRVVFTACSAASATRSRSRSRRTSRRCRRRSPRSSTTSAPSTSTGSSVLRDQVFALDHLFMSLFSTVGWIVRLVVTLVLLVVGEPAPRVPAAVRDPDRDHQHVAPGVERKVEESVAPHDRLAKHLFLLGTTAPAGKELRVEGIGEQLVHERREAWDQWYHPIAHARTVTALWHTLAWALFGGAYVGAIVYVAVGLARQRRRRAARRRRRQPALAVRRRRGRRARLPARDLARLVAAAHLARGLRREQGPHRRGRRARAHHRAASGSSTCRSRTRAPTTTRSPT